MRPRMPGIFSLLVQSREEAIFYLQDITGKSLWFREGLCLFDFECAAGEMKMLCVEEEVICFFNVSSSTFIS